MSNDIAWIFPTHAPNFAHTARLLNSAAHHGIRGTWVPLFSTADEAAQFYAQHDADPNGVHLVIGPIVGADRLQDALARRSIVNLKKFAALWELHRDFEVIHVIDTEAIVLHPGDASASFALRENIRAWPSHGHNHPLIRGIQAASVRVFDLRDQRRLLQEVLTDQWLYSWFEDVPTYRREDVAAFFEYFGSSADVTVLTDALSWETFDYLLYQYFCCLRRGWRLADSGLPSPDISVAWWEMWRAHAPGHREMAAPYLTRWAPSWVSDPGMADLSPNAFIAYHQETV